MGHGNPKIMGNPLGDGATQSSKAAVATFNLDQATSALGMLSKSYCHIALGSKALNTSPWFYMILIGGKSLKLTLWPHLPTKFKLVGQVATVHILMAKEPPVFLGCLGVADGNSHSGMKDLLISACHSEHLELNPGIPCSNYRFYASENNGDVAM